MGQPSAGQGYRTGTISLTYTHTNSRTHAHTCRPVEGGGGGDDGGGGGGGGKGMSIVCQP